MKFVFKKKIYSKVALFKAAYQYIDDYYIHLDEDETNYFVDVEKKNTERKDITEKEFLNEMILQETRKIVEDRTKNLRETIYARAMASTIIDEEETTDADESVDANNFLVDWFDNE